MQATCFPPASMANGVTTTNRAATRHHRAAASITGARPRPPSGSRSRRRAMNSVGCAQPAILPFEHYNRRLPARHSRLGPDCRTASPRSGLARVLRPSESSNGTRRLPVFAEARRLTDLGTRPLRPAWPVRNDTRSPITASTGRDDPLAPSWLGAAWVMGRRAATITQRGRGSCRTADSSPGWSSTHSGRVLGSLPLGISPEDLSLRICLRLRAMSCSLRGSAPR